jgi:cytochrome c biogenesis protein CcmG, thiol:disulfide interchange protein DsbE
VAVRSRSKTLQAKTLIAVLCCAIVAFTGACGDSGGGDGAAAAGPGHYETLEGKTASLADLRGKPVVVNFFASWCTPCRLEMPDFERVHVKLGDRVHFVGLNLQEDAKQASDVVAATKVTYGIGLDRDGAVYRNLGGLTMPTTVLLDAKGTVVNVHAGSLDSAGLTNLIADKLGVT